MPMNPGIQRSLQMSGSLRPLGGTSIHKWNTTVSTFNKRPEKGLLCVPLGFPATTCFSLKWIQSQLQVTDEFREGAVTMF